MRIRVEGSRAVFAASLLASVILASTSGVASATPVYQVPSGIAGDCSVDVTQSITNWIASVPNNSVLSFGSGACYRIEGTLQLSNRSGLDLEGNGATFRALTAPTGSRAVWRIIDSTNVDLHDMTLNGDYAYGGTHNSSLEGAHGIALLGSSADIGDVTLSNVGGDCVYFGQGQTSAQTRSSGTVHDSTCKGTGRNGISVVAGDNVLVQHLTLDKIGYNVFDVEPNTGGNFGSNNATFDSNTVGSYAMNVFSVVETGPISNASFTNNTVIGHGLKIAVGDPTGAGFRPQNITISGNSADTPQAPTPINIDNVDGLTITGNSVPMTSGTLIAVTGSCSVSISGNSFPGGSAESWFEPWICSMSPSSGPVGSSVTLGGSGFTGVTTVALNGMATSFTASSASQITLTVPSGASSGPIRVTTKNGTATSANAFTVGAQQPAAPQVTSFTPTSGPAGTTVTLTGSALTGATSVTVNGTAASFTVNSATQITLTVPNGASSGPIRVTTPSGTATSSINFTLTAAPQVTSFTPTSGPAGTTVTLTGSALTGATSVTVNGTAASFTVNSATQITLTVPNGASSGPIRVTTPSGTATSSINFTLTAAPQVTSFTPTSGPAGTTVTLTGSALTGATSVTVNGTAASFTVNSATQITLTVPSGASSGPIRVTTPSGTATSSTRFTVTTTGTKPSHGKH